MSEQKVSPTKSDQEKRDLITLERGWGRRIVTATTPTTNGLAVTTGYLVKSSSSSSKGKDALNSSIVGWKKRFFMLRGSTLTYYDNHQSMNAPKGELLVFGETKCHTENLYNQKFSFTLSIPFAPLNLACENLSDFNLWTRAFENSILLAQQALRSYIDKFVEKEGSTKRKYFILHQDAITFHKDDSDMSSVQGLLHLNDNTLMEYYDRKEQITLTDTHLKHTLVLLFEKADKEPQDGVYLEWKEAITARLRMYSAVIQDAETSFDVTTGLKNMIKNGTLCMRPLKGGDVWPEQQFFINAQEMVAVNVDEDQEVQAMKVATYEITPNCSVFETNLGPHTFELVTASKVLHVQASSIPVMHSWIEAIREAISRSYLDTQDPLFQQSILKIDHDEFYTVNFTEKKPLGVVFERSGEWAIIKSSANQADSGILVGSVLSSINEESVILNAYQDTIDRLKGWLPPLSLSFRKAPTKNGYLLKESKSRSNPQKKVWKKRYFVLTEGKLLYKDSMEIGGRVKGECPLMGSVVSLIREGEAGKKNCFRLMSGMMYLTLQCANEKQMMEWASSMYHAISIANGGAYILQYERDRMQAEMEDAIKMQEDALKGGGSGDDIANRDFNHNLSVEDALKLEKVEAQIRVSEEEEERARLDIETARLATAVAEANKDVGQNSCVDLEIAIAYAMGAGVGHEKILFAEQRLEELREEVEMKEEAFYELEECMRVVQYQNTGALESAVEKAREKGVNVVDAELLLLDMRLESRRVNEASAKLYMIMEAATCDNMLLLERAIISAREARLDASQLEAALKLQRKLNDQKEQLDQVLADLQAATVERSLPSLTDAVNAASEIGFSTPQLAQEIASAKEFICVIRTEDLERSLIHHMSVASLDAFEGLAAAVEGAQESKMVPKNLEHAQDVLNGFRQRMGKSNEIYDRLKSAVDQRDIDELLSSLDLASEEGLQGPEVDRALSFLSSLRIEQAEAELQTAMDQATVDDFRWLERLVSAERSLSSALLTGDSHDGNNEGGVEAVRVGPSALLRAAARLSYLRVTKEKQILSLERLQAAIQAGTGIEVEAGEGVESLEQALTTAEEVGLSGSEVEVGRELLWRLRGEVQTLVRLEEEEKSKQEQLESDQGRAIAAIEGVLSRREPSASSLEQVLDAAVSLGVTHGKAVDEANKVLAIRKISIAEAALQRALDASFLLREGCEEIRTDTGLEEAIEKARIDNVDNEKVLAAVAVMHSLKKEVKMRQKALSELETAVEKGDHVAITQALEGLAHVRLVGSDIQKVDHARKVCIDLSQKRAMFVLKTVLKDRDASEDDASTITETSNESIYINLLRAVEEGEKCLRPEHEDLVEARMKLNEFKEMRRKRKAAASALSRAMDEQDILALEAAIAFGHSSQSLLSKGDLVAAKALLDELKQSDSTSILATAMMNERKSSKELSDAVEQGKRDGVKAHRIAQAEASLLKLQQDEVTRSEIDSLLIPAIENEALRDLEVILLSASSSSVTSKTIEAARVMLSQLRLKGDETRILVLLKDSLKMRSVVVLERVIKSAIDAGITDELLEKAVSYLEKLKTRDELREAGRGYEENHSPRGSTDQPSSSHYWKSPNGTKISTKQRDLSVATGGKGFFPQDDIPVESPSTSPSKRRDSVGQVSDDDDIGDDEDSKSNSMTSAHLSATSRNRRTLFRDEDLAVEEDLKELFASYCSKIDGSGAPCRGFINAMHFSSIWRMISGEKGNLFREMQLYKRFDVDNQGALSNEDFLDGWATLSREPSGPALIDKVSLLSKAKGGFSKGLAGYKVTRG